MNSSEKKHGCVHIGYFTLLHKKTKSHQYRKHKFRFLLPRNDWNSRTMFWSTRNLTIRPWFTDMFLPFQKEGVTLESYAWWTLLNHLTWTFSFSQNLDVALKDSGPPQFIPIHVEYIHMTSMFQKLILGSEFEGFFCRGSFVAREVSWKRWSNLLNPFLGPGFFNICTAFVAFFISESGCRRGKYKRNAGFIEIRNR